MPPKKQPKRICKTEGCGRVAVAQRKECCACRMAKWRKAHRADAIWHAIKDKARRRGIPFKLTKSEFMQVVEATGYLEKRGRSASSLQIDRIDANGPYSLGNVRIITCSENASKGAFERYTINIQARQRNIALMHYDYENPKANNDDPF